MSAKRLGFLLLVLLACGKSRQQRALDDIEAICNGLVGQHATLAATDIALSGANVRTGILCPNPPSLLVTFGQCPAQTQENPECQVFYEWGVSDPGLCSPQGGCCYFCEVRVMKADATTATPQDAVVCAARWVPRQFCQ